MGGASPGIHRANSLNSIIYFRSRLEKGKGKLSAQKNLRAQNTNPDVRLSQTDKRISNFSDILPKFQPIHLTSRKNF
jgi:hypothetical protein